MKTQISKRQISKGMRGIVDLTSTQSQTLKQFGGIYGQILPECDGLTVEGYMSYMGVERFTDKNGKKGGYTPGLLMKAWNAGMKSEDGTAKIFKNVPAKYQTDDEGAKYQRVFTKEEAEKIDGKPISRYMLVEVPENKWSVATILKGLKQGKDFSKENDKMVLSDLRWEQLEHVYVMNIKKEGDKFVRTISEVCKEFVQF